MPIEKHITVEQGATHVEEFTIEVLTDPLLPFNATTNPYIPLDLTTADVQMQVRPTYNSSAIILTATTLNGRFVKTNAVGGVVTLTILPDDTRLATFNSDTKNYLYDIIVKFSTSNILKIAAGNFIINREITRIT